MPIWVPVAKAMIKAGLAQRLPAIQRLMGDGLPYLKYYSKRILGSPNEELRATQQMLNELPDDIVDLSLGAPDIDPTVLHARVAQDVASGYPSVSGIPELRQAVARKLRRDNRIDVDPEHQILITNGVSQGIGLVLDTFVDWGERVVVFDPSFFIYRLAAMNRGAKVGQVPTWMEAGHTRFEERSLKKALRGAKLLFLNSPSNPTGGILAPEEIERIAYWCQRYDVLIFSDEVYERFHYEGAHLSIGSLPEVKNRVITANGFSKSHGMAALRVGYLTGARYLIQPMIVSALSTSPFVSLAAQQMALAALEQPPDWFEPVRAKYQARRQAVSQSLHTTGLVHDLPAGAFYFWIPVRVFGISGSQFAAELLREEHVKIMAGESSGNSGKDYIRISYAGAGKQIAEGLARLKRFVSRRSPYSMPVPGRHETTLPATTTSISARIA